MGLVGAVGWLLWSLFNLKVVFSFVERSSVVINIMRYEVYGIY